MRLRKKKDSQRDSAKMLKFLTTLVQGQGKEITQLNTRLMKAEKHWAFSPEMRLAQNAVLAQQNEATSITQKLEKVLVHCENLKGQVAMLKEQLKAVLPLATNNRLNGKWSQSQGQARFLDQETRVSPMVIGSGLKNQGRPCIQMGGVGVSEPPPHFCTTASGLAIGVQTETAKERGPRGPSIRASNQAPPSTLNGRPPDVEGLSGVSSGRSRVGP